MNIRDRLAKSGLKGCPACSDQERVLEKEGPGAFASELSVETEDLHERLTPRAGAAQEEIAEIPTVSDRLRRLGMRSGSQVVTKMPDAELAEALGGQCLSEGLIAVENELPLHSNHGEIVLHSLHDSCFPLLAGGTDVKATDLLFLDTETTGLSGGTGTLVFLLGLARIEKQTLRLCQFFLTAFRGENFLLNEAVNWFCGARCLVTFNGRAFDLPLLTARYRLSRIEEPFGHLGHIDLLYFTRSAFSRVWPDCRLQTAEQRLLKFRRSGDLPGCLIPKVWFDFVRSGTADQLPAILKHNRLDLVSLAALLPALHLTYSHPHYTEADHVAIARTHLRFGNQMEAFKQLSSRKGYLDDTGLLELAAFHRRNADWESAVSIWRDLARRRVPEAMERLAKYYEHMARDYAMALSLTEALLNVDRNNLSFLHRKIRLKSKLMVS